MAIVIVAMSLLSSVPPMFASSNWSKPRPSEYTVYNETVGNAESDSKCSVGLSVEIYEYLPDTGIGYDTLRLRVITSANTRKSIEYGCGLSLTREYNWYSVSKPTNITGNNTGTWLDLFTFTFLYYGVEYQRVWVCSNGFIALNKTSTSPNPQSIPNTDEPNPIIAAFWRDLHPENGGTITYGYVDQDLVVSWNGVPDDDGVPQTFQIVIEYKSPSSLFHNKIYFQYKDITKNRYTVVGVENQIGNRGDSYDYNDLENELCLECSYSAIGYRLDRLKITLTKIDSYAKIELKETDVGGYNVFLENYENPYGEVFLAGAKFVAGVLLPVKLGIMLSAMLIVPPLAEALSGQLSRAEFESHDAGSGENEAFVYADCAMEEKAAVKPYDATLGTVFEWDFLDDNTEDHSLTVTAEAWYQDQRYGDIYTIDTSATLDMLIGHTLTIESDLGGTTDPAPGNYRYLPGESVTVTAASTWDGFSFSYWTLDGELNYANPITVTMHSDHTLKAWFSGGGGGETCPTLFSWNGTDYVDYGVINIHHPSGEDLIREVPVQAEDVDINWYRARFRLREGWPGLNYSESVIDQVKLYADIDGEQLWCPLLKATHSEQGNVLPKLWLSDDRKTETYLLETIDLTFAVPYQDVQSFTFVIEGCNMYKQ